MAMRTYANDVWLNFGPLKVRGRLFGIRDNSSAAPGFKYCTPDGKPVEQRYVDEEGNVYEIDELERAVVEDGVYALVDKDAIASAKGSELPLNEFTFTAHPREQVEQFLYPSGKHQGYVFEPQWRDTKNKMRTDPANTTSCDIFRKIVENPNVVFVSEANLQNHEGLFQVGLYQGMLCLQRQNVPSELHQFESDPPAVERNVLRKAEAVVADWVEEFAYDTYKNHVTERLLALQDSEYVPSSTPQETTIDCEKLFDDFSSQKASK